MHFYKNSVQSKIIKFEFNRRLELFETKLIEIIRKRIIPIFNFFFCFLKLISSLDDYFLFSSYDCFILLFLSIIFAKMLFLI